MHAKNLYLQAKATIMCQREHIHMTQKFQIYFCLFANEKYIHTKEMYIHAKNLDLQAKVTYVCQRDHVYMPKILHTTHGGDQT